MLEGFNVSTNVVFNWVLNSLLANRQTTIRSYYSLRTVCPACAAQIQNSERRKFIVVLMEAGSSFYFLFL